MKIVISFLFAGNIKGYSLSRLSCRNITDNTAYLYDKSQQDSWLDRRGPSFLVGEVE